MAAAVFFLSLLYLAWLLSNNVRFRVRHTPARLAKRLAGAPFTAFLIAFVEELLFRAMVLAALLEAFGKEGRGAALAVAIGTLLFAGAHYVRAVKRYWTFPGHVALGLLFCVAFVCTGSIWLSLGLHAGGVLVLTSVRPFIRYTGPAWLVGQSIFPYAGVPGYGRAGRADAGDLAQIWVSGRGAWMRRRRAPGTVRAWQAAQPLPSRPRQ